MMREMTQTDTTPRECDVAIIGGGIAGLTAAALLSKAGLNSVVLEAQSRPGGCMAGFDRQGFSFETAIQWMNQCNPGGFVHDMYNHVGCDFPVCKPLARINRYKGDSFDYLLTTNPLDLRERFIQDFPDETDGIRRFFEDARKLGDRMLLLRHRGRAMESMSSWEKGCYGMKMLHWALPVWKHLRASAEKGLQRYFKGQEIRRVFCTEETFMSILVPIAWAFHGDFQAPPVGGSQTIIRWLCDKIRSAGSRVLPGRRVREVLLDGTRAVGVSTTDGESIRARYVLAACDLESLYERMLPDGHISRDLNRRLHEADLYYSSVTLFMGLDCDAASLGFNEENICLSAENVSRDEQTCGDPHKTALAVLAPSFRDPTLAPEGKGNLVIHCPAYMDYSDNWKTGPGLKREQAYRDLKQEFASVLVDRVEKALAPGLRNHIEVMETATPITYWRYTGNRAGSIMGASPSKRNIKNRIAHYHTPVQNLILGGHWAEIGGGVPIAVRAAANASLIILKDCDRAAFKELLGVFEGVRS